QPLYGAFVVKRKVHHTLVFPLAPGSCKRSSALMARQTPLLGRAFAVNPRSPKGRAGRREGLTAKARAELQWCPRPLHVANVTSAKFPKRSSFQWLRFG